MVFNLYMHPSIVDVAECFGSLSEVAARLCNAYINGWFDEQALSDVPARDDDCKRYRIPVNDNDIEDYLELLLTEGRTNKRLSLRRMFYVFVDYELYNEWGWEQKKELVKTYDSWQQSLDSLTNSLMTAYYKAPQQYKQEVKDMLVTIRSWSYDRE